MRMIFEKCILMAAIWINFLLSACAPQVTVKRTSSAFALPANAEVSIYASDDILPLNSRHVGSVEIGDTGFSLNCGLEAVMRIAKSKARKMGGNGLQLIAFYEPDLSSTCYRLTAKVIRSPEKRFLSSDESASGYTESSLRKEWTNRGIVYPEGIYEKVADGVSAKYKIAVHKRQHDSLDIIYISGALETFKYQWKEGDYKAKATNTGTAGLYKMTWYMADKSIDENVYASINQGLMKVEWTARENTDTYIKLFPTSDSVVPSINPNIVGSGTGFALNNVGYIVTNQHVIKDAAYIYAKGIRGDFDTPRRVRVEFEDSNNDLAILRLAELQVNPFGEVPYSFESGLSDAGERVFALGYPLRATMGDEIKITDGIISSRTGFQGDITSYQTSVAVQPGNSGGPLFNTGGDVIGVISAKHVGAENASYAVKISYLLNLIEASGSSIEPNQSNAIRSDALADQVRLCKDYVYIIESRNTEISEGQVRAVYSGEPSSEIPLENVEGSIVVQRVDSVESVGDSQSEEISVKYLHDKLVSHTTYLRDKLGQSRLDAMAELFEIPGETIVKFRWGVSLAPPNSIRAETKFYTVWYSYDASNKENTSIITLYIDATGEVVDMIHK